MNTTILFLVTLILYIEIDKSTGQPIKNETSESIGIVTEEQASLISNNHTIGDLIPQQTNIIKKSVTDQNQQQASTVNYPVVTKIEPDYYVEVKKQIDKLSEAELKIKCQHLSKLAQVNKTNQNIPIRPINHKPYELQGRPVYIQPKPSLKPKYSTTPKTNGFYITQNSINAQKPATNVKPTPIKYIRLEPVILQKTILSDGRTVYYWHRSLPTAVEIASDSAQTSQISSSVIDSNPQYNLYNQPLTNIFNRPYTYGNVPYQYAPLPQNPYNTYVPVHQNGQTAAGDSSLIEEHSTETSTESSTTSTAASYGYGFGSFLPFYSYRQDTTTTTTEPTTTTTTTTPRPVTDKIKTQDLLYAQQLKFIIPVPYEDHNGGARLTARNPWDFDQYAYYPKDLQPNTMNLQVPYNPTFQMIRAIAIPNKDGKSVDEIYSA